MKILLPRRDFFCFSLASLGSALMTGCARYPSGIATSGPRLLMVVSFTVRGRIQQPGDSTTPFYYYCVINRTNNLNDSGPVPIISTPWGNGFAAPDPKQGVPAGQSFAQGFVGFVRYSAQNGYRVFSAAVNGPDGKPVLQNPVNNNFTDLGPPNQAQTPQAGESALSFQLDLSRLPNNDTQYIQVNFITTNYLPIGVTDAGIHKLWDALGDPGQGDPNHYVTFPARAISLSNSQNPIEPDRNQPGDVRDTFDGRQVNEPDLDIVDWAIQIQSG